MPIAQFLKQLGGRPLDTLDLSDTGKDAGLRYVYDPCTLRIIDMRHFVVLGKLPRVVGDGLEVVQLLFWRSSAMKPQDFYSNGLGRDFYQRTSGAPSRSDSAALQRFMGGRP